MTEPSEVAIKSLGTAEILSQLAQTAVHAAMAGKTEMVVGQWHDRLVHIPMQLTATGRKLADLKGELWASVLESTGQPVNFQSGLKVCK